MSLSQGPCAAPGESENGTCNAHGRAQALEAPESGSSTHEAAAIPGDGGPVEADLERGSASAQLRGEGPGDSQFLSLCKRGPGDQPGFMDTTMGAALGVPLTGGGGQAGPRVGQATNVQRQVTTRQGSSGRAKRQGLCQRGAEPGQPGQPYADAGQDQNERPGACPGPPVRSRIGCRRPGCIVRIPGGRSRLLGQGLGERGQDRAALSRLLLCCHWRPRHGLRRRCDWQPPWRARRHDQGERCRGRPLGR